MNRKTLHEIEQAVIIAQRKKREGVRGQGRLDSILAEALDLIQSPLYDAAAKADDGRLQEGNLFVPSIPRVHKRRDFRR